MPLLSTSSLVEFLNVILPQITLLILGWIGREAYRLSRSVDQIEDHAHRNRELIKGLHDLEDITDAINDNREVKT